MFITLSPRVSEAATPPSHRWEPLLASDGPERRAALQGALDGWHSGRWVIKEEALGRGSSGAVFESSDSHLGSVAIKFSHNTEPRKLVREAALMQRVAHERVCKLYEYHVADEGRLMGMVMELLEKGNLAQRIKSSLDGHIREFEVIQVAFDVLSALESMHGHGVIHRDLKPANIVLTKVDGRLVGKLIDFSISAVERESRDDVSQTLRTGTTTLGELAGTPHYMSPEQIREGVTITAQTDLWSLGVVMYESLSGVLPFAPKEHDRFKITEAIVTKEPPEISDAIEARVKEHDKVHEVGAVTDGIASFTLRALQKDLTQRFGSAAEMIAALNDAITMSGDAVRPLHLVPRLVRQRVCAGTLYGCV